MSAVGVRRVLVTASRSWVERIRVNAALEVEWRVAGSVGDTLVVVHGDCPTGGDRMAKEWVTEMRAAGFTNVEQEAHPADWGRDCDKNCYHKPRTKNGRPYCPMAGHLRNQKMVDRGADVCRAFPLADSRGTVDCMRRAKKAGIEVIVG